MTYSNQRLTNNLPRPVRLLTSFNPELNGSWKARCGSTCCKAGESTTTAARSSSRRTTAKVTDASFKAQVISTVAQIQNIYWDLVNAYEDLKVKQTALEFAQRTLTDNKKQVEIGTLAPIEVVSAQSSVATATQNLIASQTNLQYQQLITKNAIARNFNDPQLTAAEVIPTDTMALSNEPVPSVEELVSYALANRPELLESELNLKNNEINNKAAKNALLPTVDLVGYYGSSGLASNYGDVFSSMVNRGAPDKGAYVSLTVPLRNRAAQSKPDSLGTGVPAERVELPAAEEPDQLCRFAMRRSRCNSRAPGWRRLARPETMLSRAWTRSRKKFNLGASTSYLVLQQQSNSTQAASNYVAALSTYEKARVALDQVTASILDKNGISMEDAASGHVAHMPAIPGLQPNLTPSTVTAQPIAK